MPDVPTADGKPGPDLNERQRRLLVETGNVIVATIGPAGRPQVTPTWFLWDDPHIFVSAARSTVKVRNIRRDPRVTLCIDAPVTPATYVQVTGEAEVVQDADGKRTLALIAKYVEADGVQAHWESIREDHVLLRIRPHRWQWFDEST